MALTRDDQTAICESIDIAERIGQLKERTTELPADDDPITLFETLNTEIAELCDVCSAIIGLIRFQVGHTHLDDGEIEGDDE